VEVPSLFFITTWFLAFHKARKKINQVVPHLDVVYQLAKLRQPSNLMQRVYSYKCNNNEQTDMEKPEGGFCLASSENLYLYLVYFI